MYLSRIELNKNSRETIKALAVPSRIHGMVENCFPRVPDRNDAARHLWRLDHLDGRLYVLIVSPEKPDFLNLTDKAICVSAESRDYDSLLERIRQGQQWHFRLTANPTRKGKAGKDSTGRVYNECTREQQMKWLLERCESHGFSTDADNCQITRVEWFRFRKRDGNFIVMQSVTYEGILTVIDQERFIQLLSDGIGREKAYGMGMITIAGRLR